MFNNTHSLYPPFHPGEYLKDMLDEYGLTQTQLARDLHVSFRTINELVQEKRSMSMEMALRLGKYFDMSAEYWINHQIKVDKWKAQQKIEQDLESIETFKVS